MGGSPIDGPGFFMEPTVLVHANHSMDIMTDETFGPVLPIMPFRSEDEAFSLAADTPYGLGASVYTETPALVERTFRELNVGTVWVNDPVVDNLAAPFGGNRSSGDARELGIEALRQLHNRTPRPLELEPGGQAMVVLIGLPNSTEHCHPHRLSK